MSRADWNCTSGAYSELLSKLTRNVAWLLAVLMAAGAIASEAHADAPKRPNIVYILADDLGWKDVGFHGSDIRTPALDDLAKTGAQLQQFYAMPMCTPTRAALMTGRYPMRYGLQTAVIPSGGKYGLATDEWLLPQMFKDAGYDTAIVGKWHLGHAKPEFWPRQRGLPPTRPGPIGTQSEKNATALAIAKSTARR